MLIMEEAARILTELSPPSSHFYKVQALQAVGVQKNVCLEEFSSSFVQVQVISPMMG